MTSLAPPKSEQLISRRDLARRWSTSVATIKRREHEGLLVRLAFNKRLVRYRLSDVEKIEKTAVCQ